MYQRSNPKPGAGDALRDQAADMLSTQYGEAKTEYRAEGKKVDVFFENRELGRTTHIYLEAKDYERPLKRNEVVNIKSDYEGILRINSPAVLLLVTRSGLTADAQSYIDKECEYTRHQTIWQIETGLIDLETYLRHLVQEFLSSGLSEYYVENGFTVRAPIAKEHEEHVKKTREIFDESTSCFEALSNWVSKENNNTPVAILGGYGTGKTSLATRLAAYLAEQCLHDSHARQPIVLKLGEISQYANIEGLLGGYFTNTFPIRNFNFHNFLTLNKKGRFVIILDGFDEMKHSMSWSDFKAQVKSLLQLYCEKSKIILLGRPSAFLSELEERHILKGERPVGESWVTLPDWPRFHELEINNFNDNQRELFITKYLSATSLERDPQATKARAALTNEIASEDPQLYEKPVHSKILTDLARDPSFNLSQFRSSSSRWLLYKEFMSSLYERETEKRTRRDISTEKRISFLGDLALWLWIDRNSSISFRANDIPRHLFGSFSLDDEEEFLPLCRELLVGSILEKKSGDTFFFGHRSFAEFIVADCLLKKEPEAKDHENYSSVFRDGVREFLVDATPAPEIGSWSKTFGSAAGRISQAYIDFLADPHGGIEKFLGNVSAASSWQQILQPFKSTLIPDNTNYQSVMNALSKDNGLSFAWHYCWLTQLDGDAWQAAGGVQGMGASAFDRHVLVCLFEALFSSLLLNDKNLFVKPEYVGLRRICHEAVKQFEFEGKAEFEWSHHKVGVACMRELNRHGLHWEIELDLSNRPITTDTDELFNKLSKNAQDNLLVYLRYVRSWSSITERAEKNSRRREINRTSKRSKRNDFKIPKTYNRRKR